MKMFKGLTNEPETAFHHIAVLLEAGLITVSYTHLDVYKRQGIKRLEHAPVIILLAVEANSLNRKTEYATGTKIFSTRCSL